jgi:hypothetical protein
LEFAAVAALSAASARAALGTLPSDPSSTSAPRTEPLRISDDPTAFARMSFFVTLFLPGSAIAVPDSPTTSAMIPRTTPG